MKYAGFLKSSFIDFPQNIAAVVFAAGCNFRCPYCHNKELLQAHSATIEEEEIFNYCKQKKFFLDGVVFSGGEISRHEESFSLISALKKEGFKIKIDTNGTNSSYIAHLLEKGWVDYIAMDIKAPLAKYEGVVKAKVDTEEIQKSIALIQASGVDYEFRTTVCKGLHHPEDIKKIGHELKGSKNFVLQNYKDSPDVICGPGILKPFEYDEFKTMVESVIGHFEKTAYRFNQSI